MGSVNLTRMVKAIKRTDLIVTPRLQSHLLVHGDDPLSDEVAARMKELMTTPPRDRSMSFSASSAGQCLRAQMLQYLGVPGAPVDSQLANIFNDGKWRHLRWQAMMLMAGILTSVYDIEDPQFWPRMRLRGTMDGVGVVPDDHPRQEWRGKEYTFELKGVSAFLYQNYVRDGPRETDHLPQVARYFLMTGYDLAVIIVEDKSTQAWEEWVIERTEPKMQRIIDAQKDELIMLNRHVDKQVIPFCDCRNKSDLCRMYPNMLWPKGV